ncbi:unnamed protein product [Caenorhabditis sp. 36 PRJEB53466]|nr:unnamed protein product [Caenorhabditis sp. 36 PRJEB53466]
MDRNILLANEAPPRLLRDAHDKLRTGYNQFGRHFLNLVRHELPLRFYKHGLKIPGNPYDLSIVSCTNLELERLRITHYFLMPDVPTSEQEHFLDFLDELIIFCERDLEYCQKLGMVDIPEKGNWTYWWKRVYKKSRMLEADYPETFPRAVMQFVQLHSPRFFEEEYMKFMNDNTDYSKDTHFLVAMWRAVCHLLKKCQHIGYFLAVLEYWMDTVKIEFKRALPLGISDINPKWRELTLKLKANHISSSQIGPLSRRRRLSPDNRPHVPTCQPGAESSTVAKKCANKD